MNPRLIFRRSTANFFVRRGVPLCTTLGQKHGARLSDMFSRQFGTGKPIAAHSASRPARLEMSSDMLPEILGINFGKTSSEYAGNRIDPCQMVHLTVPKNCSRITADLCATSKPITNKTRFQLSRYDFDQMRMRGKFSEEVLQRVHLSQLPLKRRRLFTA